MTLCRYYVHFEGFPCCPMLIYFVVIIVSGSSAELESKTTALNFVGRPESNGVGLIDWFIAGLVRRTRHRENEKCLWLRLEISRALRVLDRSFGSQRILEIVYTCIRVCRRENENNTNIQYFMSSS
jgi:hypothetical protein